MIEHAFSFGSILITDAPFGHVGVGDSSFAERLEIRTGSRPEHIAWMDQVHSPTIQFVEAFSDTEVIIPKTDGMITNQPSVTLITKTADCVPILLWNEPERVIAALHCGWRGFLAGIIESFVTICEQRKFNPEDFSAFLGPHLRKENFEVKEDFLEQLKTEHEQLVIRSNGKSYFDMTRGVREQLTNGGVQSIEDCGIDTYSNEEYFSFRRWSQSPETTRPKSYNTFANCIIMR